MALQGFMKLPKSEGACPPPHELKHGGRGGEGGRGSLKNRSLRGAIFCTKKSPAARFFFRLQIRAYFAHTIS